MEAPNIVADLICMFLLNKIWHNKNKSKQRKYLKIQGIPKSYLQIKAMKILMDEFLIQSI